MQRFLGFPIRAPRLTLAVLLAVTGILGFFARSIRVNSAIENLLPEGDPDRAYYDLVRAEFGSEEGTVIALFAADVFAPRMLAQIDELSSRLTAIEGIREVLSLTTVRGADLTPEGLRVGRLLVRLPQTAEDAAAFRKRVLDDPLYAGNLVSADGTATSLLVLFEELSDDEFIARGFESRIRRETAAMVGDDSFAITGLKTLKVSGAKTMERDLARFIPLSVLVVMVVLGWEFRTLRGALLPLLSVLLGVVWTTGVMVLNGRDIDMGTLILPPLLIAAGVAYAIHVLSRYGQELRPGRTRAEVVEAALAHSRLPVGIAALTTMIGFSSLAGNPIGAIRNLGLYSVFGIGAVLVLSMTFLPAVLMLLPLSAPSEARAKDDWLTTLLQRLGGLAARRRWLAIAVGIGLAAASAWGARWLRVETDYIGFFDEDSTVRLDSRRIAERLGGSFPIYLVVDGGGADTVSRLEVLEAIRDLKKFVAELPGVDGSLALTDYLTVMQSVLDPESEGEFPETQREIEQILLFADPEDIRPVANRDFSRANVIARTRLSGSAEVGEFVRRVTEFAESRFPRGVHVRPTGTIVLLNHSADTLARGQLQSLAQVLLVLLVLMSLLFLSLRAGLLSLVPNVIPIVVLFGAMGWTGIPLNVSTSMIAVIAIGIAVDDTIHYLSEFSTQFRAAGDRRLAILRSARTVGRPIVFTSLALVAGFLVVCLSGFQPIRHFGILASLTVGVALFADLFLTPALLMTASIVTLWDLLYVKLGPEPQRQIPLFAGLRPFQAKIVVLMARLASAGPGAFITRFGETKAELYVLLSGRVEVYRHAGEPLIRSLERGSVIGEMGLVRQRPRSADVVVSEPTEYLVLDGGFLRRIQRRHPRIAARVFLNLTKILSDRVEATTEQLAEASRGHV